MRIMMVCLGNICRSPLAEALLKRKIEENGLDWQVESSGTSDWHNDEPPCPGSQKIAKKNGIDISDYRSELFNPDLDFDNFDLILAMDGSNYRDLMDMARTGNDEKKIKMIMNYVYPGENRGVPDPFWSNSGFEDVFNMLELAAERIVCS